MVLLPSASPAPRQLSCRLLEQAALSRIGKNKGNHSAPLGSARYAVSPDDRLARQDPALPASGDEFRLAGCPMLLPESASRPRVSSAVPAPARYPRRPGGAASSRITRASSPRAFLPSPYADRKRD